MIGLGRDNLQATVRAISKAPGLLIQHLHRSLAIRAFKLHEIALQNAFCMPAQLFIMKRVHHPSGKLTALSRQKSAGHGDNLTMGATHFASRGGNHKKIPSAATALQGKLIGQHWNQSVRTINDELWQW
jgi:hypothetical protein